MRNTFVILMFSNVLAMAQVSTLSPEAHVLQAYILADQQPCVGFVLEKNMSVEEIAQIFHTTVGAIYGANRLLGYRPPQQGDLLDIPVNFKERLGFFGYSNHHVQVVYTVRKGETLFRIARRYFDLTVEMLTQLNHLDSPALSPGQTIILGYLELRLPAYGSESEDASPDGATETVEDPFVDEVVSDETGVALWNKEHPEFQQLFVMHRTARINSLLEITNPMFGRTLFVKVVGKIPRTFSDDITVVVSPGVARQLGAIDSRFYVRLRYVK